MVGRTLTGWLSCAELERKERKVDRSKVSGNDRLRTEICSKQARTKWQKDKNTNLRMHAHHPLAHIT